MLTPLGAFSPEGSFRWSDSMWKEILRLELTRFVNPNPEGTSPPGNSDAPDARPASTTASRARAPRPPKGGASHVTGPALPGVMLRKGDALSADIEKNGKELEILNESSTVGISSARALRIRREVFSIIYIYALPPRAPGGAVFSDR